MREVANGIYPDLRTLYTPEAAEADLKGFEWRGPGWYLTKLDAMLVLPSNEEGKYWFWVYLNRNPHDALHQAVNAPVRVDERE